MTFAERYALWKVRKTTPARPEELTRRQRITLRVAVISIIVVGAVIITYVGIELLYGLNEFLTDY
jgi:hypothetical protein